MLTSAYHNADAATVLLSIVVDWFYSKPHSSSRGKIRGKPKSLGFIL